MNAVYQPQTIDIFLIFAQKHNVVGTHWSCLSQAISMSLTIMFLCGNKKRGLCMAPDEVFFFFFFNGKAPMFCLTIFTLNNRTPELLTILVL